MSTTDSPLSLVEEFAAADLAEWRALASPGGDEAGFESALVRRTRDGLARGPLLTRADLPAGLEPLALRPREAGAYPWDVRAIIRAGEPARANAQALADLAGGASSLEICLDPDGVTGIAAVDLDGLDRALAGVALDLAPVSLDAGPWAEGAAACLAALWDRRGVAADARRGAFNIDPLTICAVTGQSAADAVQATRSAAGWAEWGRSQAPQIAVVRADARKLHEAGGSAALEIGWAAACAAAYLRAAIEHGAGPDQGAAQIAFAVSVDADIHQSIAKLRALRRVWEAIASAHGAAPSAAARIDAFGSRRMLTARDAWTNMIRLTNAGFAAAAGGADAIALPSMTDAIGRATPFARRVTRNIQMILMEEAHAGRVADPAAGGFHHEALTDALARRSWTILQEIEREGGPAAFAASGALAARVAEARRALERDVAARGEIIVGVSDYARLDETPPGVDDHAPPIRSRAWAGRAPRENTPAVLIAAAADGAPVTALGSAVNTPVSLASGPLAAMRVAEPFERLRDAADAHAEATGEPPRVFLAALGPMKANAARLKWIRNIAAAGGISATAPASSASGDAPFDAAALAADWSAARTPLAIIAAADHDENDLRAAVGALADTGATVWVVGPAAAPTASARVIDPAQDVLALLADAHAALGIAS